MGEQPVVRRMWAPRGCTPALWAPLSWKKLSVALGYRWDGAAARLNFKVVPESFNGGKLRAFVEDLRHEYAGQHVILVWDRLPAHRYGVMGSRLPSQRGWLEVEHLPAYAPEENPVEGVVANCKGKELAERCENTLSAVGQSLRKGLRRIARRPGLLFGFGRHDGVFFLK